MAYLLSNICTKITGIGQLLLKLSLVDGWYPLTYSPHWGLYQALSSCQISSISLVWPTNKSKRHVSACTPCGNKKDRSTFGKVIYTGKCI